MAAPSPRIFSSGIRTRQASHDTESRTPPQTIQTLEKPWYQKTHWSFVYPTLCTWLMDVKSHYNVPKSNSFFQKVHVQKKIKTGAGFCLADAIKHLQQLDCNFLSHGSCFTVLNLPFFATLKTILFKFFRVVKDPLQSTQS